jgi:hypothetical protein
MGLLCAAFDHSSISWLLVDCKTGKCLALLQT